MLAVPRRPRPDLFRTETLMIFGMTYLTFVHVLLSLIGILAGLVVLLGLLTSKQLPGWTAVFIWSTVATSVTGFLFPFHPFLPSDRKSTRLNSSHQIISYPLFCFKK